MTDKGQPEPDSDAYLDDLLEVIEDPEFLETMQSAQEAMDAQRTRVQDQLPVKEPIVFKAPDYRPPEVRLGDLVPAVSPAVSGLAGKQVAKKRVAKKQVTKPRQAVPSVPPVQEEPPLPEVTTDTYQDVPERLAQQVDVPLSAPVSDGSVRRHEVTTRVRQEDSLIGKVTIPPIKIKRPPSEERSDKAKKPRVAKKASPKEKVLPKTVKTAPEGAKAKYEARQKQLEKYVSEDAGDISVES